MNKKTDYQNKDSAKEEKSNKANRKMTVDKFGPNESQTPKHLKYRHNFK